MSEQFVWALCTPSQEAAVFYLSKERALAEREAFLADLIKLLSLNEFPERDRYPIRKFRLVPVGDSND